MKIVRKDSIYVQKNDITKLLHLNASIPASILTKVFGQGVVIIDDSNRYEFVKFEEPEEIEFIEGLDWIIDYEASMALTLQELIEWGESVTKEKNETAKKFNSMSQEKKSKNTGLIDYCELLEHKIYSIRDVIWIKQGRLKFPIPKKVSIAIEVDSEGKVVTEANKSHGIKKFIQTMINHRKK